ncbi:MAG: biotin-dependent carboxyltransferase family protein [Corynebacterium sp.]|nr:biotin-dependent carboxyltransferase family protein [Corynebacterium sp.]
MLRIIQPAAQMLIEDAGRYDYMSQGIPVGGFYDRTSARRANSLVGNEPNSPVVEILGGNAIFEVISAGYITICGFNAPITIDEQHFYTNELIYVRPGQRIHLGIADNGARSYLALQGGVQCQRILGSSSRDILSNIGPEPLAAGDTIEAGEKTDWAPRIGTIPNYTPSKAQFAVVLGPRDDWFDTEELFNQEFSVESASNRIGIRLKATRPLSFTKHESLPSEGIVRGSIQVPPDGNPVIFGPDHPITGGYPVIGVLVPTASDYTAQLLPGEKIHFIKFCT